MKKNELLELLKDIAEDGEINEVLQGIEGFAKPFDVASATLDDFKNMLANNEGMKGYYQSELDSKVSKGINTWKENNLNKLIEEGIKAKSNEGLTEEQKTIKELQAQMQKLEDEKLQNELLNTNRTKLKENKLSEDLAKYVKEDSDIDFFKALITNSVNDGVKEKINNSSYNPPTFENGGTGKITWEQVVENPSLIVDYNKQNN